MNKFKDFIEIDKKFQNSINLQLDIDNFFRLRRCMKTSEKNFLERKTIEHDSCVFVCCRSIVVS